MKAPALVPDTLRPVLDGLPLPVFVLDAQRDIVQLNDAARAVFGGLSEGENFVQAVRHPECLATIDAVLGGGENASITLSLTRPVPAIYRVTVAAVTQGARPQVAVSFQDISAIREAEQMRSEFVANVSHELRSPLTALSGFIETLKGPARDDAQARERFLDIMEREADRMSRLIGDLLSLSKVEVSERQRPGRTVQVAPIIRQVIALLQPQTDKSRVKIGFEDATDGTAQVLGDKDQLAQVMLNLIENAMKYGPQGDVAVTLRHCDNVPGVGAHALAIDVADHGPGIAREHVARLTERFYRVDDSRSRDLGGTGLGLAIVKHILSRHRGRLQISSSPGQGSVFSALLPLHQA
jgi:two-component system, OmpR family, phosphate regulon sensor histidine kinase PhoR